MIGLAASLLPGIKLGQGIKGLIRPLAYLAAGALICLSVWLVIRWDEARFEAARIEADKRVELAIESRDNHWRAEIERGNREVAERQAARAIEAARAEAEAGAERSDLLRQIQELRTQNAALPGRDLCGLDQPRVRLLRKSSRKASPRGPNG